MATPLPTAMCVINYKVKALTIKHAEPKIFNKLKCMDLLSHVNNKWFVTYSRLYPKSPYHYSLEGHLNSVF